MTALLRTPEPTLISDPALKGYLNELNRVNGSNLNALNNQLRKATLTGTITLTDSAASTTLSDAFIKAHSLILMMPTTASAGVEAASGNLFYTVSNGSIVVSHTNSGVTDRTFSYLVFIN